MRNPHNVTREFEQALCDYTGARYACAVNSCTMAILLACAYRMQTYEKQGRGPDEVPAFSIPRPGYISVPQSIIHAGGRLRFRDEDWLGAYQLEPHPIWDSARWFTRSLFDVLVERTQRPRSGPTYVCVSFHASKTLGLEQGGAILHDDENAVVWLARARFDGRMPGVPPRKDRFDMVGWHCYMNPSTAAQGLLRLYSLAEHNQPLPNDDYPDLSTLEVFKPWRDDL